MKCYQIHDNDQNVPAGLSSFQVFYTRSDAEKYMFINRIASPFEVHEYELSNIENPTFIDMFGDKMEMALVPADRLFDREQTDLLVSILNTVVEQCGYDVDEVGFGYEPETLCINQVDGEMTEMLELIFREMK